MRGAKSSERNEKRHKMRLPEKLWIVASVVCILFRPVAIAEPGDSSSSGPHLKFALILTRHGIRSPTWTNDRLNEYAKDEWPKWNVAPGMLTPHGKALMVSFGGYYREYFASQGLFSAQGCSGADQVYFLADKDQRTTETGHALAEGLFPGCASKVHTVGEVHEEALFHPTGKVGTPDSGLALAAVAGRIGADPATLLPAIEMQLQQMQRVLFGCPDDKCVVSGRQSVLEAAPSLQAGSGDHLVTIKGPLPTGATMAENFQLEYLEGMPLSQIGWGRVDERTMRSLMLIHSASSDLIQRTPYIARAQGSNLLAHIQETLDQAELHKHVPGAIGSPDDKVAFLVGHDTNIANVAALLDAHWLLSGYQRDDAAPGGALVFELWHQDGQVDSLRTYYVVQTPNQMRNPSRVSLENVPAKAVIFLPGCSGAGAGFPCSARAFSSLVDRVIDPAFVEQE
jgi:4-phytase / acid phosphatase